MKKVLVWYPVQQLLTDLWCVHVQCGVGGHYCSPAQEQQDGGAAGGPRQAHSGPPTQQQ